MDTYCDECGKNLLVNGYIEGRESLDGKLIGVCCMTAVERVEYEDLCQEKQMDIRDFIGMTVEEISVEGDLMDITFSGSRGRIKTQHALDWFEDVWLNDGGDVKDLVGEIVLYVSRAPDSEGEEEGVPFSFYHLGTKKGWITLRWSEKEVCNAR